MTAKIKRTRVRVNGKYGYPTGCWHGTILSKDGKKEMHSISLTTPNLDIEIGKHYWMHIDARYKNGNVRHCEPVIDPKPIGTAYLDIYGNYDPEHVGSTERIMTCRIKVNDRTPEELKSEATRLAARHGQQPEANWKEGKTNAPHTTTDIHLRRYTGNILISLTYWKG